MLRIVCLLVLFLLSRPCLPADTLHLYFVGDVMGHGGQVHGALMDGGDSCYDYRPVFLAMKKVLAHADLAVANLEVTLAGPPYTGYPQFSSPDALAVALQDAGFDALVLANNHSLDRGRAGLARTVHVLDSLGIPHTGVFTSPDQRRERYPLLLERNGLRIALLNYTYGTNGIQVQPPQIVNYIDTAQIRADHRVARALRPDLIVTCIHWGVEYERKENPEQRFLARFLAESGSDLIIGSHPHVVQPFEWVTGPKGPVPVIYSLGNVVSNQRDRYTDGGIIFHAEVVKGFGGTRHISVSYEPFWVYRYDVRERFLYRIIPLGLYHQYPHLFRIPGEDKDKLGQFEEDTRQLFPSLPVKYSLDNKKP
jgi:poly-gamma-glutamate synthesis protein (capsule biosynthesis protein)